MAAADAIDFAELGDDAQSIIEANGRACTFTRASADPADAAKPWRASASPGTVVPEISYSGVIALLYDEAWDEESKPMDQTRRPDQMLIVAENSFPSGHVDVRTLQNVSDGIQTWRIVRVSPVQPGATNVIYQMRLEV